MIVQDFKKKKQKKEKITVLTCYDSTFAKILATTPVDAILVGDSLSMVIHGHSNTLAATTDLMALHVAAVSRGGGDKFIIGDMPFMSFRKGLPEFMGVVEALMRAGAHSVKLEGAAGNLELVKHCVESGVPVMGHLGLTPQMIHSLGGNKVQGRKPSDGQIILDSAKALEQAGCFALVLECVPNQLAQEISQALSIPTIGIGAGMHTDGQVLVLQDMLGMNDEFSPKFLRKYLNGSELIRRAIGQFCEEVGNGQFPGEKESYHD